ncbi:GNAT family N-acetyltransferase [Sporolactobacillus shoreicorticis]|uniref:GNAT family N-acetyltransferase n=1 Tax=Sporolactobacillus shoreicorticis TaxID=1923877 RepID=A0ABW5RZ53_9BACL|nr:GNAT family N-acetyltransferase [Sporolactobacillus shoreicorticis]MCO7124806.1 GNAT family N-acetyltransferase [Sporolactobacillus shoreicorticis]
MGTIEIRPVHDDQEWQEALDLWVNIFPKSRAFFEERIRLDPNCQQHHTWIAKVNEHVAGAVQIFPFFLSYLGISLKCGGIGNVAALPEYRGRHLIRTILNHQTEWMAAHGYDLSLLFTGINSFYEKEGWQTLPMDELVLNVSDILEMAGRQDYQIRPFNETDLNAVQEMYRHFIEPLCGARIRTDAYWKGQMAWNQKRKGAFLNAFDHDELVAYLRWEAFDENKIGLVECCYLPGHEDAVASFMYRLKENLSEECRLMVQMPERHALWQLFLKWSAHAETYNGAMWRILRVDRLFQKIQPVLSQRLSHYDESDRSLLLRSGSNELLIHLRKGVAKIEVPGDSVSYSTSIERNSTELLSDVLLGTSVQKQPYAALFPKSDYAFWKSDRF